MCTYVHGYANVHICAIYVGVHLPVCVNMLVCVIVHMHECALCLHVHVCMDGCSYMYECMRACLSVHVLVHVCVCIASQACAFVSVWGHVCLHVFVPMSSCLFGCKSL